MTKLFLLQKHILYQRKLFNLYASCSGYMSPEYAIDGKFSVKSDVFSFGVLLLEIVSGKKNRKFSDPGHYHNLLGHVRKLKLYYICHSLLYYPLQFW